jgi:hypothetical protein
MTQIEVATWPVQSHQNPTPCPSEVIERSKIQSRPAVKLKLPRMKPDQVPSGPNAPFLASTDNPVTYGLSIVFVLSGLLLERFLEAHFVGAPVSLLLCAVMLSGWFGGLGAGLLSSILAFLAFEY